MTGEILSHFEILETLGEGGMGVVYKARDIKLDRIVAIKLLPRRMLQSDLDRERFSLEAKAAANLSHPNVCTVFEYDEVDGQALIAMECIEGPSLKDRISEGALPIEEAKRMARQIASGLQAAHAKGIVHRDIKPGNVLITEDGTAKITDFGLVKMLDATPMTQTGISLGTIMYMSPEQARGDVVTPAVDVWSFGAVLFEMLTGTLPFPHAYQTAILYAIVNEDPQNLDGIEAEHGQEIATLIRRCLNKDPAQRPTAAAIAEMLGGDATTSQTVVLKPSLVRTVPWKPLSIGLGAVMLTILGLLLFLPKSATGPDFSRSSIAILPVDVPIRPGETGLTLADSTLKLTLDGLLQTVSSAIEGVSRMSGAGNIIPFGDIVEHGVSTPDDAEGKLGADYAIGSRIAGYDPVPTLEFTLIHNGDTPIGRPVSVPVLLNDLQGSYEATLVMVGGLLGIPDSILAKPSSAIPPTSTQAFQLYTRSLGLLQQRSSVRSLGAAQELLESALKLDPEFANVHAALGLTDLYLFEVTKDLDLLEKAERHCDAAMGLQPELIDSYVTLGRVHAYTGKPGQAQRSLEMALDREPFNINALLALADLHASLQRFNLAEETYKKAINSNPEYWGGYNRLGMFYFERSEWDKAAEQYQKVVDLAPLNAIGYRNLGSMMWFAGKPEEARRNWELSLEIEPAYTTYNNLGTMHFYELNYTEAATAYRKALEINDKDHRVWSHLATSYYWMKAEPATYLSAKRKAVDMAERWLEVNPTDLTVKSELAGYYGELREAEKSRALLQEFGMEPTPGLSSHIGFQIGAAWEVLGERETALRWIGDALLKGYSVNEVTSYPGLEELRSDTTFVRIINSLQVDTSRSS